MDIEAYQETPETADGRSPRDYCICYECASHYHCKKARVHVRSCPNFTEAL